MDSLISRLKREGFRVGARDPKMNTDFAGAFMVAEHYEDGYTQPDGMGGDGVWCIVGDDLNELVTTAADFFGIYRIESNEDGSDPQIFVEDV